MGIRLDQSQMDQIIGEIRRDADFITQGDLTNALGALMKSLKSKGLHTPNRSGGANGPEVIKKITGLSPTFGDSTVGALTSNTVSVTTAAPTSATPSQVDIGQADSSVKELATLDIRSEETVTAIGTFTPTFKYHLFINGLEYAVQLDPVA